MSLFAVIKNGAWNFTGALVTLAAGATVSGGNLTASTGNISANLTLGPSGDVTLIRQAANTLEIFDGSTNASTVLLGSVDFRQAASTFGQTATILNGPRAANPVAWVEVKVSGSTGRVPVW